jgi:N-acetylneuraminate lyase
LFAIIFSEVNVSQISGYVKYLVDNKVDGVYIIGTTGEGYNLTNDEKLAIAKAWRKAIDEQNANLLAIINVTSTCIKEALQLSKQVESLGYDAIAVLPPNYYKPTSVNDLINYFKLFGSAAPNTPLLYYHIPFMVGEFDCKLSSYINLRRIRT